jgi:hypothetical protein
VSAPGRHDAGLGVDVLHVVPRSARRDAQALRDRGRRCAACEQAQHLDLARAQAGRPGARLAPHAVAGGAQHGVGRGAVEPAGLHRGAQLARRVVGREGGALQARLGHRVVRVGGRQHA